MKKIVLTLSLLIASLSFVNASNTKLKDLPNMGCWEAAEQAEAAYCGSVGCNFDYFFAYASQCADGTIYIE